MVARHANLGLSGQLGIVKNPNDIPAPLSWRLKNMLRKEYIWGEATSRAAGFFSKVTGIPTMVGSLSVRLLRADGSVVNFGKVGSRVITTAFAEFVVDQLIAESSVWGDFKFHDSGVGTTAANVADTDIETTDAESRATGTQSNRPLLSTSQ